MADFHALGRYERDILLLLAGNPGANGNQLRHKLEECYGERIHSATFYDNLNALVKRGYVVQTDESEDARSYANHLSEEGDRVLDEWLAWLEGELG